MNLFEMRGVSFITERKINDINIIKSKIESQLNSMKARTFVSNNIITFSTLKFYVPSGSLMNRSDSLRVIKEGEIEINKDNSLTINWLVKLDSLYFLALCCSIVAGIIVSTSADILTCVGVGIVFFLVFIIVGIVLIKARMNDLINSCVYQSF